MMQFKCICIRAHTGTHVPSEHGKLCNDVETATSDRKKQICRTDDVWRNRAGEGEEERLSRILLLQWINNGKLQMRKLLNIVILLDAQRAQHWLPLISCE